MSVLNDQEDTRAATQTAKDEASGVAGHAKSAAGDVARTSTEQAKEVAGEAKRHARDLAGEARTQLKSQTGEQRQKAAGSLRSVGDELRQMADRSENGGIGAEIARQASTRAHDFAGVIEDKDPSELLDDVRRFARERPAVFLLGAALAGVALGRLTRGAVAAHRDDDSNGSRPSPTELSSSTYGNGYASGIGGTYGADAGDLGTTTASSYTAGSGGVSGSYGDAGTYGETTSTYDVDDVSGRYAAGTDTVTDPADTGLGTYDTGVTAGGGGERVPDTDAYGTDPLVDEPRRDV